MALRAEYLLLDLPLALSWSRRTRRWSGTASRVFVVRLAPGPAVESENAEEEWHYDQSLCC